MNTWTLSLATLGTAALYFAAYRLKILWLFLRARRRRGSHPPSLPACPKVCIQCPCYNEPLVIADLLEAVTRIRWGGPLEIQILDDSSDDTAATIAAWLAANPARAANVRHVRRADRGGFKAGALNAGLALTDAPFIAVFDADFRPAADFLEQLMPYFADAAVGVVQARWEFANRDASLLTRLQAAILDIHFVLEQTARSHSGLFFNFNGTAGIWRRKALEEGGGWSADTVTEDLDLSYRSQLVGWRFVYVPDYAVESELPETITAFKSQQRRWTKGGVQVARRQLGTLLRSEASLAVKAEAASHLTVNVYHLVVFALCVVFAGVCVVGGAPARGLPLLLGAAAAGVAALVMPTISVLLAQSSFVGPVAGSSAAKLRRMPLFLLFSLAMSLTYSAALVEGLLAREAGEFVRTPKGRAQAKKRGLLRGLSGRGLLVVIASAEATLGVAGAVLAWWLWHTGNIATSLATLAVAGSFAVLGAFSVADVMELT